MSEVVPILGARTLRSRRTLCEGNMRLSGPKRPTSVVVLRRWEGLSFSYGRCLLHPLHIPHSCTGSNTGIVQNVGFEAPSPKVLIRQVWTGAEFWHFKQAPQADQKVRPDHPFKKP